MSSVGDAREVAKRLGLVPHPDMAQVAEAIGVFAPLGWAMCGRWHQVGTLKVLRQAVDGAGDREIDEALTELWNDQNATWLRLAAAPIRSWSNSHYPFKQVLWDRVDLIEKAISHHLSGNYEASIPIILAQIDGMSRDLTGASFFSKSNNDPYLDDATLAGMEQNLPIVRRVFSQDVRESGSYGLPSRHGVLHGRDLGYATRVNSTKTIVLVAALAEYFPRIADDAGARLRQLHEEEVSGSTDVDQLGRLVDDRHVPEIRRFAYDVDTAYMNAVLLHGGGFDVHRVCGDLVSTYKLDADRLVIDSDQHGWWWHYCLPSGHVLGYASLPSTSSERRHPDVWRWDDIQSPTAPPWNALASWRSDDDFPRSPNWEPDVVI